MSKCTHSRETKAGDMIICTSLSAVYVTKIDGSLKQLAAEGCKYIVDSGGMVEWTQFRDAMAAKGHETNRLSDLFGRSSVYSHVFINLTRLHEDVQSYFQHGSREGAVA